MRETELSGLLAAARTRVGKVRQLLVRPRACHLDECVTLLREAQGYLEWLRDRLAGGASARGLRGEARALAAEIRQAGALLAQAASRSQRWLERLRAAGGYTAEGGLLPLAPRGSLSILG